MDKAIIENTFIRAYLFRGRANILKFRVEIGNLKHFRCNGHVFFNIFEKFWPLVPPFRPFSQGRGSGQMYPPAPSACTRTPLVKI